MIGDEKIQSIQSFANENVVAATSINNSIIKS